MQAKSTFSDVAPVLIAIFFLVFPISALLTYAWEHRVPVEDYEKAVIEAMRVEESDASRSLLPIDPNQSVTVVTWTQQNSVQYFKLPKLGRDTWVTVAPHPQSFCQDYVKSHNADLEQLTVRLKQRLGLPLEPTRDTFVEFRVNGSNLFRPCFHKSGSKDFCSAVKILQSRAEVKEDFKTLAPGNDQGFDKYWVLNNYYRSYASNPPYPWTALGYTFDWAPKEDGSGDFVKQGESEFVVPAETTIQFVSSTDTTAYCTPR
jgi:hypothetical protein